jgi:hypothetical protein
MVELTHQRDLPEKPVRRDADQKLGVQNLQGDRFPRGIGRVEDARRAPAADLPIDLVVPSRALRTSARISRGIGLPVPSPGYLIEYVSRRVRLKESSYGWGMVVKSTGRFSLSPASR